MDTLKVGEVCEALKGYSESVSVCLTQSGIQLVIALPDINILEVKAVAKGQASFKLLTMGDVPFMFCRFGNLNWMECVVLGTPDQLDSISEMNINGVGYGLQVILVDSNTHIVKALRLIGVSQEFSKAFNEALLHSRGCNTDKFLTAIRRLQDMYSTDELVRMATISYRAGDKH